MPGRRKLLQTADTRGGRRYRRRVTTYPGEGSPANQAYPPAGFTGYPPPHAPAVPKVDPTYAWVLAFMPLLSAVLPLAFPATDPEAILGVTVVANSVLAIVDQKRLQGAGIHVNLAWAVFLVPVYLIMRSRAAKSTPAIPVIWFIALLASFIVSNVAGPVVMDSSKVQTQLQQTFHQRFGVRTTVICPNDPQVQVDSGFRCNVLAPDGLYHVMVTVTDHQGRYSWHLVR